MRCYFHLLNGHDTILDDTGLEVSNLEAMRCYAFQAICELREETSQGSAEWQGWRLDVVDSAGHVLLSVPLETTLQ